VQIQQGPTRIAENLFFGDLERFLLAERVWFYTLKLDKKPAPAFGAILYDHQRPVLPSDFLNDCKP
jgi:hypothetical protein